MPKASSISPSESGRVTVKSIAAYAGVSIGSVSTVLNNHHEERRISPETVERIRAAAAKLGYLPNISARRLRSSSGVKNNLVLALVTSFEAPIPLVNHFISGLRDAIAERAAGDAEMTFSVMIEMYEAGRLQQMPGLLTGDHFNAAIIMNTTAADDAFLGTTRLPYPVVLVNRLIPGFASVVEAANSGARVAEVLVGSQRRRMAVLRGDPLTQTTRRRRDGFVEACEKALRQTPVEIIATRLGEAGAYEAMTAALAKGLRLDGLYAVSDALALGAYRALKEKGLRIPGDVGVVGVGDYDIAPFFDPPLASVGVNHSQLAREAGRLLLSQMGPAADAGRRVPLPMIERLAGSI